MLFVLIISRFLEPDVMDIESYDYPGISFTYHIVPCAGLLTKIHSQSQTVIPSEHRQRYSEGDTHGVHIVSIQLVISLVIIYSGTVGTSSHVISDVVPVWNNLKSKSE